MRQIQDIKKLKKSTQKTAKITHAMQLVSASKLAKTQQNKDRSKEYSLKIREVVGHISSGTQTVTHPYIQGYKNTETICIIIVSTDRGLCGNLNSSLFKRALESISNWQQENIQIEIATVGKKARQFFEKMGFPIIAHAENLADLPQTESLLPILQTSTTKFKAGLVQEVHLFYNQFINTMTQKAQAEQILPVEKLPVSTRSYQSEYEYEPDAETVLLTALDRYIESIIYQAVVENIASEQAARMLAMKNATDNARNIIYELNLAYNKARQALITGEIAEIVAGAEALN